MLSLALGCFLTPLLFAFFGVVLPEGSARRWLGPYLCLGLVGWALVWGPQLSPPARLLVCSLWLLYCLKGWSLLKLPQQAVRSFSPLGLLLYSYPWPGVDPRPFQKRREPDQAAARWFVFGFPTMCLGILAMLLLALHTEALSSGVLGLAGTAALLVAVHLGYSDILSSLVRLLGFRASRLFVHPLASRSLNEFWSRRWNGPFVEMNRLLFRPLLKGRFSAGTVVVLLFLLSGLLHELALSFPAQAGWGGPLAYFAIQGGLMLVERRWRVKHWNGLTARMWTWFWLLAPAPLLFHGPFRENLVLPLYAALHSLPPLSNQLAFAQAALTAVGCGHFLVLVASFQVPHRLGWKEELARLRPLNRKLLWTYGAYIVGMITTWGILTLNLRPELLAGDRSALALALVIAIFWWSRIVVDTFYFEHSDWPEGVEFILGHTMLTSLFVTIASTYTTLLIWHWWS